MNLHYGFKSLNVFFIVDIMILFLLKIIIFCADSVLFGFYNLLIHGFKEAYFTGNAARYYKKSFFKLSSTRLLNFEEGRPLFEAI